MREFAPSSTYFVDRERRLVEQLDRARNEVEGVRLRFQERLEDLSQTRASAEGAIARLRSLRASLSEQAQFCRELVQEMLAVVVQCETLSADAASFLQPGEESVAHLDAEIASLEEQKARVLKRPAREKEKLERRLSRLRLRRDIAERSAHLSSSSSGEEALVARQRDARDTDGERA